ncbi:hypothetical protein LUX29_04175 [Aureimonas altamirensis]|uniref:hypothetical protein n=1 Tax=Aureimonas altamirensis TaxID=370622 RepID=UPI001E3C179A|nr:hypothetical protein [Aureimonas altamirensis]UHD46424.1 hypothetical protein LUX29_04175 [Aureimonas altamirensis]
MAEDIYLVVNVDTDPDPVSEFQDNASLLAKYGRMQEILAAHTGGAAAWTVLTGSKYRDRFYRQPFLDFWAAVIGDGADLVLHPEEDLYGPGPGTGRRPPPTLIPTICAPSLAPASRQWRMPACRFRPIAADITGSRRRSAPS